MVIFSWGDGSYKRPKFNEMHLWMWMIKYQILDEGCVEMQVVSLDIKISCVVIREKFVFELTK